jgi:hypothetical protein
MMFEQLPAPAHVLALRFSGKITGEDIKGYKSVLEGMLQKHDRIGACCDLSGLADLSALPQFRRDNRGAGLAQALQQLLDKGG